VLLAPHPLSALTASKSTFFPPTTYALTFVQPDFTRILQQEPAKAAQLTAIPALMELIVQTAISWTSEILVQAVRDAYQ